MAERHFIASIGVGRYSEVEYRLEERSWRTRFAPVAVARLLGLAGARASVLVTAQARAWYEELAGELRAAGLGPEAVEIGEGRTEEERLAVFEKLVERVQTGAELVLDVTFALRHLPFVYLAALVYLVGLRGARLKGIYYGAYDLRVDGVAPVLDVTGLFGLVEWYHALETARESGDLNSLARRLGAEVGRLFRQGAGDPALGRAKDAAQRLAAALAAGLPLEVGLAAADLKARLGELESRPDLAQAGRLALQELGKTIGEWAVEDSMPSGRRHGAPAADLRQRGERRLVLDREELERQLRLASWYAEHGDLPKTLLLLREWLVSAGLWALGRGDPERWLAREERLTVERRLGALGERARHKLLGEAERPVAELWGAIAERRNRLAHAGMTSEEVRLAADQLRGLIERCRALLAGDSLTALQAPAGPRLLVAPLGLAPGALFSAVRHLAPEQLLVVTSTQARGRLAEALAQAGRPELKRWVIELADPHQGFGEIGGKLDERLRRLLVAAGEVVVSLTGGTTALQYAAQRIGEEAERLGVAVRRVALIDRRPRAEQEAEPYVLGELVELDGVGRGSDGGE